MNINSLIRSVLQLQATKTVSGVITKPYLCYSMSYGIWHIIMRYYYQVWRQYQSINQSNKICI